VVTTIERSEAFTTRSAMRAMSKTMQVPWRVMRPGATVVGHDEGNQHKVVTVDHQGTTVSVLYWDGTREVHSEDAYTRVLLNEPMRASRRR
jgi:hypothetical protein